jgi:hypothetical protein
MWALCRLLLLLAGVLVVNFQLALRQGEFALPLSVTVVGLNERQLAGARLHLVDLVETPQLITATSPGCWDCPPRCIVEVALQFAEPVPANGAVHVKLGGESFTFPLQELDQQNGLYTLPQNVHSGGVPWFANCRNWPGREVFVRFYLTRSAPGVIFVLILALATTIGLGGPWRSTFPWIVGLSRSGPSGVDNALPSNDRFWNAVGWLSLIGGFFALECLQPYYFTQDDVLVGELPAAILGCRSLWDGIFPNWNPYVFLGAPLAPMGFWSITYPPMLASYGIARHVLGDENATMEVLAALHLLAGFVAQRWLCRQLGMGAFVANIASLSLVFAGCILIMGRSWHYFVAYAVWLPLLGLAIERFREGPVGWKWILGVGLVLGLAYHAGFPQIVAILGMFLCVALATVAVGEVMPLRRVAPVVPALLLGVGLAMPLLFHHLEMTGSHERFVPVEHGVYDQLQGALLPYPLAQAELPTGWGSFDLEKMGQFYSFSGLFALLFAIQAVCFWTWWPDRAAWARSWWIPCGMVVLVLALGDPALLWKGMAGLPLSKIFLRYTIRFYPVLAFCAIVGGGLILERFLSTVRRRRLCEFIFGASLLSVLAYHVAMCQPSFYTYGFGPYPELPQEFEDTFHPYPDKQFVGAKNSRRMASWAPLRTVSPDFYTALPLNLPHYYQVPGIFGYDPIVEGQPRMAEVYRRMQTDPSAAYRAYGVGWHLDNYSASHVLSPNRRSWNSERTVNAEIAYRSLPRAEMKVLSTFERTILYELPGVDPLAFAEDHAKSPLPMRLHCGGADIDVAELPAGTRVTINFLWYPQMQCYLDGQPLPAEADEWQRVTTILPGAGSSLTLRYEPGWLQTCAAGAIVCVIALSLAGLLRRYSWR